jgi:penicillin-insensitive murein endopeptidase
MLESANHGDRTMAATALRQIVLALLAGLLPATIVAQDSAAAPPAPAASAPARDLFGAKKKPAHMPARAIGFYNRGCLAGAVALPVDGPHWQAMRLSRNRMWGHPNLVQTIERITTRLPEVGGWDGILIGDLSQPRGGPMVSSHASHQIGLDVDIWLTPWPERRLTSEEREQVSAINVVAADWNSVNPEVWTPQHLALVRTAAQEPLVERVLVNAAIKKELCRIVTGDRSWLHKVRPYYGHHDHIHVRISCPKDFPGCKSQAPVPPGDGCDKTLAWWFSKAARTPPKQPAKPRPPMRLSALPPLCREVLTAP